MEDCTVIPLTPLEESTGLLVDARRLQARAERDGFLFLREIIPGDVVQPLRRCVRDYARRIGWLDPTAPADESRVMPDKRIGDPADPDWVGLQAHVYGSDALSMLGNAAGIRRALRAAEDRPDRPFLSAANICRVCSPHSDMATPPHRDGEYVQSLGDFWTAWIPLEDCPQELGPIAVVAGSHRDGPPTATAATWSTTDFRVGDVLLFRPQTLHRSLPNRSGNRLRFSVDLRYAFSATAGD